MSEKLLRVVLLAVACLSLFVTHAQGQQDTATWLGGNGNYSNAGQWICDGPDFPIPGTCVPNGGQFAASIGSGLINVDINVNVGGLAVSPSVSLSLNGTSLTSGSPIAPLASAQLTNGAVINPGAPGMITTSLTMQDSMINGTVGVSGQTTGSGSADVSNSTIQKLAVAGFFDISNSTLGNDSVLIDVGFNSEILNTSYNGVLDLSFPAVVTVDNGSKINSVLSGTPQPLNVGMMPNSSSLLLVQGGSQITVNGNDITLGGGDPTAQGQLTLNDTSSVAARNEFVGKMGTGEFTQNGSSTNTVSMTLTLGDQAQSSGFYTLNGTSILTATNEIIGNAGSGDFTQNSGTQTLNGTIGTLTLGSSAGGSGQYTLGGAGNDVTAGNEVIGDSGEGTFFQSAGSDNKISGTLTLAKSNGGTGTYDMSGGTLEANTEVVGGEGLSGTFKQSGGTNTVTGDLGIASNGSGLGTYTLSGTSTLIAGSETLGNDPCLIFSCPVSGTFNQMGGGNATASLTINFGNYNLSGGSLQAGSITDNGTIAISGAGSLSAATLTIGKAGSMTLTGPLVNVNISGSTTASGTIIEAGVAGATINWGDFTGDAPFKVDPATNNFKNLTMLSNGYIQATAGSVFDVAGNFVNGSTQNTLWDTSSSVLDFTGGGTHEFDLAGKSGAGFSNNFAWGTLALDPGNTLDLVLGSGDALYAFILQGLMISGNTITNVDGTPGLFLYYDAADNPSLNGNYNLTGGGELIAANGPAATPEPTTLLLFASGLGSLLASLKWRGNRGRLGQTAA